MWTLFNLCFAFFTLEDIQLGIFQYMSQCYTIVAFIYIYKKSKFKKKDNNYEATNFVVCIIRHKLIKSFV